MAPKEFFPLELVHTLTKYTGFFTDYKGVLFVDICKETIKKYFFEVLLSA
jgi:hypothetical protein